MMERNLGDKREEGKSNLKLLLTVVVVILVILIGYFFGVSRGRHNAETGGATADSNSKDLEDLDLSEGTDPAVAEVVKNVSKHMLLPGGVQITVTSVEDAEGLAQRDPFTFQHAKNGYKILFYKGGMIMYDPDLDKIVDAVRVPVINQ